MNLEDTGSNYFDLGNLSYELSCHKIHRPSGMLGAAIAIAQ